MKTINIQSPIDLGKTVRATRKHLGLTQSDLALASQVGVRFIVDLEAGKPTVRLESVMQVIGALGGELKLDGMFTEDENAHRTANVRDNSKGKADREA